MNDTPEEVAENIRAIFRAKSPSERLRMGSSMGQTSRKIVTRAILENNPNLSTAELQKELFLKFYGADFDPERREKILAHLDTVFSTNDPDFRLQEESVPFQKRPIIHLRASIDGASYILGTLHFNRGEFSYFFPDADAGHITWHNGRTHLKDKGGEVLESAPYPGSLLASPAILTPLYVESIRWQETPWMARESEFNPWQGSVSQTILTLDSSNGFSMIFLLVPDTETTPRLLNGLQWIDHPRELKQAPSLADLCDPAHRPGRISLWEGWSLLILCTPYLQRLPKNTSGRTVNFKNIPAALVDLMLQTNGL
jgi:hypothetical protein